MSSDNGSELTKDQLKTLRNQLLVAKEELIGRPRVSTVTVTEVGDAMDTADQASAAEEAGARNDRDAGRLAQIEHALAKFERGEYGLSEDSGEPIGYGRLHALPWARLTISEEETLRKRK